MVSYCRGIFRSLLISLFLHDVWFLVAVLASIRHFRCHYFVTTYGFFLQGKRAWENELVFCYNVWFLGAGQRSLGEHFMSSFRQNVWFLAAGQPNLGERIHSFVIMYVFLVQGNRVWENESVFCYNVWFLGARQQSLGERVGLSSKHMVSCCRATEPGITNWFFVIMYVIMYGFVGAGQQSLAERIGLLL